MNTVFEERIAWRRNGARRPCIGTIRAGDGAIRLAGCDPYSGVDVSLSIPFSAIEGVHDGDREDDRCVVLELADSAAIVLNPIGSGSSQITRRLVALSRAAERQARPKEATR
ncbi:MAG TPA: hypothetical protein VFB35_07890 [Gaiellaceae bacterium]|nr:hypothetical protein [Gaiellaceae bacterium]